jgi:hypothetical protein
MQRRARTARIFTGGLAPAGHSTKILWAFFGRSAKGRGSSQLLVDGRRLDGPGRFSQEFVAISYQEQRGASSYASIVEVQARLLAPSALDRLVARERRLPGDSRRVVPGAGLEPARPTRGHPLLRRARLTRSATPAGRVYACRLGASRPQGVEGRELGPPAAIRVEEGVDRLLVHGGALRQMPGSEVVVADAVAGPRAERDLVVELG